MVVTDQNPRKHDVLTLSPCLIVSWSSGFIFDVIIRDEAEIRAVIFRFEKSIAETNVSALTNENGLLLAWRKVRHCSIESPHVPETDDHENPSCQPLQRTSSVLPDCLHGGGILTDLRVIRRRQNLQKDWERMVTLMVRNIMPEKPKAEPDSTAVRVALWRALHVDVDPPPHVFEDEVGLKLASPDEGWRNRPDMSAFTRPFRASIIARARFIEDFVAEAADRGVEQYVILGAGLDTFCQRRPELASGLLVFEVDRPGPQEWKRRRLIDLGFGIPSYLRLVPVDFEAGETWWERIAEAGFDANRRAIIASMGVSMYLTKEVIAATLRQVASLAAGSTLALSFMLPIELSDPEVRPGIERAVEGARASGTPFISFFTPAGMLEFARKAGFRDVKHVSAADLAERYFSGRIDGLRPPNNSEELLLATT